MQQVEKPYNSSFRVTCSGWAAPSNYPKESGMEHHSLFLSSLVPKLNPPKNIYSYKQHSLVVCPSLRCVIARAYFFLDGNSFQK